MSGKKEQEKIYNLKLENLEKLFDFKISEIYKIDAEKDRAMELRLHGMNELRKVVEDQAATFFTRREHELYMDKQTSDALRLREKVEADAKSIREKVEADAKSIREKVEADAKSMKEVVDPQLKDFGNFKAEMKGKASMSAVYISCIIAVLSALLSLFILYSHTPH